MHRRLIDCGDRDQVRRHPPRSHRRHPSERLLPAGDRAAPKEQDDGDEDERNCRAPAGSRHVAGHLRLGDPEGQAGDRGDRKRSETSHDRSRQDRYDEKREVFTAQARDRNQEDRRQPAQCCPYGPVGDGDHVRRNRQRGGSSRILGHGGCGQPEPGVFVHDPKDDREDEDDAENVQSILTDRSTEDLHRVRRQDRRDWATGRTENEQHRLLGRPGGGPGWRRL